MTQAMFNSRKRGTLRTLLATVPCLVGMCGIAKADDDLPIPERVEFNRDVRPILSDTCYQCHGPDQAKRQANLRLDLEEAALADLGDRFAIVRGDPAKSELVRRITTSDAHERMPPADSGKVLSSRQIEILRRWVEQGAAWQGHWSLLAPARPEVPPVENNALVRNPIDAFVLARLKQVGISPSHEADKPTLIRRVTLDLTGVPPTPAEVDAYLADEAADAFERVVDRLLQSTRYGERMATRWLDAARYADTNGYQSDGERFMWRWRDWVIDAYNQNMPFDQFTIEQLAGDLLPDATLDQRIASGFNRNHRGNAEGGIIPEEYAAEYVVDRVDTTATVWLGLTLGCARCHDHKFDPVTQREFYQLFAYFNSVPEKGRAIKFGNSPPMIKAPTRAQQQALADLDARLLEARAHCQALDQEVEQARAIWETSASATQPTEGNIDQGLVMHFALEGDASDRCATAAESKFQAGEAAFAPGRIGTGAEFDGQRYIDAGNVADFGYFDKFSLGAWIWPKVEEAGTVLSRMTDSTSADGYNLCIAGGKLQVNLVKRWLDDSTRVETQRSLTPGRWYHVLATYDGSRLASGIKIYVDGKEEPLTVLLDDLNQPFNSLDPFRIGMGGLTGRFQGLIDEVRLYNRCLDASEALVLATAESIDQIVAINAAERSAEQAHKLRAYFLRDQAPEPLKQSFQQLAALQQERGALVESFPTTMVMEELPTPRPAFILLRGQYDKPGEPVSRGVPACLPPLSADALPNRVGLARWLTDPANPLTARVAVNRFWQMYFGTGIVRTVDDFGAQGEWPSHPELLDWLATEFVSSGWDIKAMQRLIVTSATYRQSSHLSPELAHADPDNRLLARGPRLRLSAEMIRDQALFASGLLVDKVGGPSVKPYQPAGLWKELTGTTEYDQGKGEDLYRRSMYTYWKRTVAPPAMMTFDAAGREACTVRETRTNTPLQALTLMNDVTYVEAARALAERAMRDGGTTPQDRLSHAFRLVLARRPTETELSILLRGWERNRERFQKDPAGAIALTSAGESPRNETLDPAEWAAYASLAGLILNLDEAITKP